MSEMKMTTAESISAANVSVKSLEEVSWQHENIEERVRTKLTEFAAELQNIKKLRESV